MTVGAYIAEAPAKQRAALRQLRAAIRRAVPGLTERISYGIPLFEHEGKRLLYIAQFREHVSVYPVTAAIAKKHAKSIARFRHGRGTLRFPLGEKVPVSLIEKLARTRAKEALRR